MKIPKWVQSLRVLWNREKIMLMLLSDWYAEKIEKEKREYERLKKLSPRELKMAILEDAHKRGLSLKELINELESQSKR